MNLLAATLLTLRLLPAACIAPCEMVATVSVEPARDNEKLVLVLEAEDSEYYRQSELPLNEKSPKTFQVRYSRIPSGAYMLTARLHKHDGRSWVAGQVSKVLVVR